MRLKRAKAYKKLMQMYSQTFNFRTPYQILVDASFIQHGAAELKLFNRDNVARLLGGLVQDEAKIMISQCAMAELYKLGQDGQRIINLAKTFERRKCGHIDAVPVDECIAKLVGSKNKSRYVVATQSDALRSTLRIAPSVPIIHFKRSVLVFEPPSEATLKRKAEIEGASLHAKKGELATTEEESTPVKRRRGPKAPNPLSIKKKKPKPAATSSLGTITTGEKRKREDDGEGDDEEPSAEKSKRRRRRKRAKGLAEDNGAT